MIKQIFDVIKNHSMNGIHVIHKEIPYFVTVHGGSPGTLTFSEKNYLPADT